MGCFQRSFKFQEVKMATVKSKMVEIQEMHNAEGLEAEVVETTQAAILTGEAAVEAIFSNSTVVGIKKRVPKPKTPKEGA